MQIHRTRHAGNFTVVPNGIAQNRKLSFTARGLLEYLISLPNGTKEDARTLADDNPGVGRKGISDALDELIRERYYFRVTNRDDQGRIRTETYVFDTPQDDFSPLPASPGTGAAGARDAGTSPSGEKDFSKDGGKNPPFPPAEETAPAAPAEEGEGSSEKQEDQSPQLAEAARIVRRFATFDGRLKLSERQVAKLAPSVADWLDRGATIGEITDAVTQGLPAKVYSAARLIADRLDRKRPERKRQWKQYADCEDGCGRVLPAGQDSGICGVCAGVVPTDFARELLNEAERGPLAPEGLAAFRAARAAMAK
ncbi:hypothetical protein [Streptomyces viridochromogenes]|uniref:hypothetical protein n=1 Tax=Streptomyces viridochromogenes TaxID=1938 RepID=UPI00069DC05E|nr:hypothetical protein [Streptomyces viridochromogenes]KOG26828.1 hypothetical protein ADK36_02415 [Streptomyces viridochromogenes]